MKSRPRPHEPHTRGAYTLYDDPNKFVWANWTGETIGQLKEVIQRMDGTSTLVIDVIGQSGLTRTRKHVVEGVLQIAQDHDKALPPIRRSHPLRIAQALKLHK